MKTKVEHVVPLSRQAINIVREAMKLSVDSRYLFPCLGNPRRCMSENTINDALRRIGYENDEQTAQGIRVMASTLLNEQGWPPDAIEKQLAHIEENEVREVYNQAKYLPVRRKMMQFWADYLDELRKGNTAAVEEFEKVAARNSGVQLPPGVNTVPRQRTHSLANSNLLSSHSLQLFPTVSFSIGASFQLAGTGSLPHSGTHPTTFAGRRSSNHVEVERIRRDDGAFASDDLTV